MKGRKLAALAVVLVAAFQMMVLGWIAVRWLNVACNGTELRFKCELYDPYDPFRGKYVRVTAVAECDAAGVDASLTNRYDHRWREQSGWFRVDPQGGSNGLSAVTRVTASERGEGVWVHTDKIRVRGAAIERMTNETWEAFDKRRDEAPRVARVELPDRLYLNEKLAPAAEKVVRDNRKNVVAVYRALNGHIIITDIEIDNQPIREYVRKWLEEQEAKKKADAEKKKDKSSAK